MMKKSRKETKKRKKDVYKTKQDENRYLSSQEDTGNETGTETNSAEEDISFFDASGEEEQGKAQICTLKF